MRKADQLKVYEVARRLGWSADDARLDLVSYLIEEGYGLSYILEIYDVAQALPKPPR